MTFAVLHISDQILAHKCTSRIICRKHLKQCIYNDIDNFNILFFIVSADVVSLTEASVFLYHIDCFRMVIHIQPVADIFSVSIYRKFLSMQCIVDDKRNQFFRELVWSIIVRTVGNVCRKMVSVNISLYQHIRRCFARRIRTVRCIRCCLIKICSVIL